MTTEAPEAMLEALRATASPRDLRMCSIAFCRRIWQHLSEECRSALEVAANYAQDEVDEERRRATYAEINAMCFYVDGDSLAEDRFANFTAEAVLNALNRGDEVPSIKNYAATCTIAASRAVVEVVIAAAELTGSPEEDLDQIAGAERRSHCEIIREMFLHPARSQAGQ